MKLVRLVARNFKSLRDVEFHFPSVPGLYFLRGRNDVEPRLGANGAGKSTLWDALTWCVYGRTSNKLKSGDVCNWAETGGVVVELHFEDSGGPHVLRRSWKPISFTLDGADVAKDAKPLGIDYAPWLHSVLMAQAQPMFLDLGAEAQAALFGEVLSLDHWLDLSQRASKAASAQDAESRRLESLVARLQGRLEADASKDAAAKATEWATQRHNRLAELSRTYERLSTEGRDQLVDTVEAARRAVDQARETLRDCVEREKHADAAAEKTREPVQRAREGVAAAKERVRAARQRVTEVEDETSCPTCAQDISPRHHEKLLSDLLATVEDEKRKLLTQETALAAAMGAEERAGGAAKRARHLADAADAELKACERALNDASRALAQLDRELDAMEDAADKIAAEVNPYEDNTASAAAESTRAALKAAEADLTTSMERYSLLSMWVRGFKDVRLQEIGAALRALEVEANNSLVELGLPDWEILLDVDKETASGSIKRGFAVSVRSPGTDKLAPWEAWSGGEGQRLRLAATCGLSNVVRAYTGCALELEVWDEPTAFLSEEGVTDLLNALSTRAHREQRVVFVVDHRSLSYGAFDGVVTAVKSAKGTTFEWSEE